MGSERVFSVVRELSRREVERHKKQFIGIVVTEPEFKVQDENGLTEYVCDIRVGVGGSTKQDGSFQEWAIIKNCLIAQWAHGIVTDVNIPVIAERGESGRVTIIARSEIHLPDLILDAYSFVELGFGFMQNVEVQLDGSVLDGYGFQIAVPGTVSIPTDGLSVGAGNEDDENPVEYDPGDGVKDKKPTFINNLIEWGSTDFDYGVTKLGARDQHWEDC